MDGEKLRELRKSLGLTREKLQQLCEVSIDTLKRGELHDGPWDEETIDKVAGGLALKARIDAELIKNQLANPFPPETEEYRQAVLTRMLLEHQTGNPWRTSLEEMEQAERKRFQFRYGVNWERAMELAEKYGEPLLQTSKKKLGFI